MRKRAISLIAIFAALLVAMMISAFHSYYNGLYHDNTHYDDD